MLGDVTLQIWPLRVLVFWYLIQKSVVSEAVCYSWKFIVLPEQMVAPPAISKIVAFVIVFVWPYNPCFGCHVTGNIGIRFMLDSVSMITLLGYISSEINFLVENLCSSTSSIKTSKKSQVNIRYIAGFQLIVVLVDPHYRVLCPVSERVQFTNFVLGSEDFDELIWFFANLEGTYLPVLGHMLGINYGQIANNLPSPSRVSVLLQSLNISRVKLYDADPNVLGAFGNTNVEFIIGIGNEQISSMMDVNNALSWLRQNVQPYISRTRITCITVGNEVFSGNDTTLMVNLLPAMQSVYQALAALGLDGQVNVTTAHSFAILSNSYPPSAGAFRQDLAQYLLPLLNFHAQVKSPFLINAYPFFAYKANPGAVPLQYVLFQPNSGVMDPNTNLNYDNMLYAQMDSVYSAVKAMGHSDVDIRISETGWPSMGDADEVGATLENAAIYNGNLLKRIAMNQGTPLRPSVPIDVFVFALFNEDLKTGPTSERNYGLFYPDGTPVYNIGLQGYLPSYTFTSSSRTTVISGLRLLPLLAAAFFI